jgi:hypothetical protein
MMEYIDDINSLATKGHAACVSYSMAGLLMGTLGDALAAAAADADADAAASHGSANADSSRNAASSPSPGASLGVRNGTASYGSAGPVDVGQDRASTRVPRASLNFAHAETIIPFAALLGLFGSDGPCVIEQASGIQVHMFTNVPSVICT